MGRNYYFVTSTQKVQDQGHDCERPHRMKSHFGFFQDNPFNLSMSCDSACRQQLIAAKQQRQKLSLSRGPGHVRDRPIPIPVHIQAHFLLPACRAARNGRSVKNGGIENSPDRFFHFLCDGKQVFPFLQSLQVQADTLTEVFYHEGIPRGIASVGLGPAREHRQNPLGGDVIDRLKAAFS